MYVTDAVAKLFILVAFYAFKICMHVSESKKLNILFLIMSVTSFRRDLQIIFEYLCFAGFGGKQETLVRLALKKFLSMYTNINVMHKK